MLKDRRNKKWVSLMLPEHVKGLREIIEKEYEIDKPELDDQEKERLELLVKEAIRDQFTVKMIYYENRRLNTLQGKLNIDNNELYIEGKHLIKDNIIDIKLL